MSTIDFDSMQFNCLEFIKGSDRPDLWAKYFFAQEYLLNKSITDKTKVAYLETIKYMNGFVEESPSKRSPNQYLSSFIQLIESIQENGFEAMQGRSITITRSGKVHDGAHRLAVCAVLGISPLYTLLESSPSQDYSFQHIEQIGLSERTIFEILRKALLINDEFRVLIIFPIAKQSCQLERVLRAHADDIIYRKSFESNSNLLLVSKYISYVIGDGKQAMPSWIGGRKKPYSGLLDHATMSNGESQLQIFVIRSREASLRLKEELRALFDVGNYSCHSSDSQFENILLFEQLIPAVSRDLAMKVGLGSSKELLETLTRLICFFRDQKLQGNDIYVVGSTVMSLLGLRNPSDIDILISFPFNQLDLQNSLIHLPVNQVVDNRISSFESLFKEFGVWNYLGLSIMPLDALEHFKRNRREVPKDLDDLKTIAKYKFSTGLVSSNLPKNTIKSNLRHLIRWQLIRQRELLRLRVKNKPLLYEPLRFLHSLINRIRG